MTIYQSAHLVKEIRAVGQQVEETLLEIQLALLTPDDLSVSAAEELSDIASDAFNRPMSTNAVLGKRHGTCLGHAFYLAVAIDEGQAVGLATTKPFPTQSIWGAYVDLVGVVQSKQNRGIGAALQGTILREMLHRHGRIAMVARTQNPQEIRSLHKTAVRLAQTPLAPLYAPPSITLSNIIVEAIETDVVAKPHQAEAYFDPQSLIYYHAYGSAGDGSTWEDMTRPLKLCWDHPDSQRMTDYLAQHGFTREAFLSAGHTFMVGALLNRDGMDLKK